jgi:hypothetical protein
MARRVRDRHCRKLKLDSGYPRKILSSERGKGDDGQTLCAYGRGKNSASGTIYMSAAGNRTHSTRYLNSFYLSIVYVNLST